MQPSHGSTEHDARGGPQAAISPVTPIDAANRVDCGCDAAYFPPITVAHTSTEMETHQDVISPEAVTRHWLPIR